MNNFRVVFYGLAVVAAVCFGESAASQYPWLDSLAKQQGWQKSDGGPGAGRQFSGDVKATVITKKNGNRVRATPSVAVEFVKAGSGLMWSNKFTLVAAAVSSLIVDQESDALASLVDSVGVSADFYNLSDKRIACLRKSCNEQAPNFSLQAGDIILQIGAFGVNFVTNYGIRKTGKYLNSNGISVKSCLGDSTAVKVSTDVVMHPQMLIFLFWTTVNLFRDN